MNKRTNKPILLWLRRTSCGFALLWTATGVGTSAGPKPESVAPVHFREHLIATLPGVYQCAVADINGDGKPDILGLSSGKNEIAWYENPTWQKRVITTATRSNIDLAAYDLDGDGKLELVVASAFDLNNTRQGGRLQWFAPNADANGEWVGHDFANVPTAHRLRWANWDGNGKKELVVVPILGEGAMPPEYAAPVAITGYAFADGKARTYTLDHSLTVAHGMRILDFDGDGRDDLLVASYEGVTWFAPERKGAKRTWRKTLLASGEQHLPPKRGSSEVDRGWLKGKRPFLATIEPWHGNEVVVYTPPADGKGLWQRHVLDATLEDGHALGCVDLDGDGQSEIIAGYRGGAHNLYGYRCVDGEGAKWERFTIDAGGMGGSGLVIADLNADKRADIICCGSNTIKWYENLTTTQ